MGKVISAATIPASRLRLLIVAKNSGMISCRSMSTTLRELATKKIAGNSQTARAAARNVGSVEQGK